MTLYLVWTDAMLDDDLPGPWTHWRPVAGGVALVISDDTLSRVHHEVKWSLPDGAALLVAPLAAAPKSRGLRPGSTAWLRDLGLAGHWSHGAASGDQDAG